MCWRRSTTSASAPASSRLELSSCLDATVHPSTAQASIRAASLTLSPSGVISVRPVVKRPCRPTALASAHAIVRNFTHWEKLVLAVGRRLTVREICPRTRCPAWDALFAATRTTSLVRRSGGTVHNEPTGVSMLKLSRPSPALIVAISRCSAAGGGAWAATNSTNRGSTRGRQTRKHRLPAEVSAAPEVSAVRVAHRAFRRLRH